jgi:hypothetical protein
VSTATESSEDEMNADLRVRLTMLGYSWGSDDDSNLDSVIEAAYKLGKSDGDAEQYERGFDAGLDAAAEPYVEIE